MDKYKEIAEMLIRKNSHRQIVIFMPMGEDGAAGVFATEPFTNDEELDFFIEGWRKGLADFLRARLSPGATP